MSKFNQKTLDEIVNDPDLFALVCKLMDVKPVSLPLLLKRNGNNLNQYSVIKAVADYKKCDPEELLEKTTAEESQS